MSTSINHPTDQHEQNPAATTFMDPFSAQTVNAGDRDPFITACPAWCEISDRHTFNAAAEDRVHSGQPAVVALSLAAAQPNDDYSSYELTTLQAYLRQQHREVEPAIHLGVDESAGQYVTLDEAERLAVRLLELVAAGRGAGSSAATQSSCTVVPWCTIPDDVHAERATVDVAVLHEQVTSLPGAAVRVVASRFETPERDLQPDVDLTVHVPEWLEELPAADARAVAVAVLTAAALIEADAAAATLVRASDMLDEK